MFSNTLSCVKLSYNMIYSVNYMYDPSFILTYKPILTHNVTRIQPNEGIFRALEVSAHIVASLCFFLSSKLWTPNCETTPPPKFNFVQSSLVAEFETCCFLSTKSVASVANTNFKFSQKASFPERCEVELK